MLDYDYEIIYKKGKENVVVDAFSRKFEDEGSMFSLSSPVLDCVDESRKEWLTHSTISSLIKRIQEDPNHPRGYTL